MDSPLPFLATAVSRSNNGLLSLWARKPLVYSHVSGHLSRAQAQHLIKQVDDVIAQRVLVEQFHDWSEMTGYDFASQTDLTLWTVRIRLNVKTLTIFVNAPVVAAGVSVANAALRGMIRICSTRDEFERRLMKSVHEIPNLSST